MVLLERMCTCAYGQLGKSGIVDSAPKRILLELQQLDHQARQGFTGRGVVLDILGSESGESVHSSEFIQTCLNCEERV